MGKLWDTVRGGTKEERERKKAEEMALKEEYKRQFYTGKIEAHRKEAKAAGRRAGRELARKRERGFLGNLGNVFEGLDRGAKAFETGAGSLVGDVDFGGIGQGLAFDGFGETKKKTRRSRPKTRKSRRK